MALFPFVPDVPGVPALLRAAGVRIPAPILVIADAIASILGLNGQTWGIYQGGIPVVIADTVVSVQYRKNYAVAEHPVEPGAFESYDKVETPFDATIRFAAGGSLENREALLSSIEAILGDTELYDVVTPERTYESVNLVSHSYRRDGTSGAGLMTVDVRVIEVRISAISDFSSTKEPTGAGQINVGSVQAISQTAGSSSSIVSSLKSVPN